MVAADADAGPMLNSALEDNSVVVADGHDDESFRRDSRALFHNAFGRSLWLRQVLPLTRVASFAPSSVVYLSRILFYKK